LRSVTGVVEMTTELRGSAGPVSAAEFDVVVIGAGFSGLFMLQRLRDSDLSVRVYEAGGDVGGTWYWNRYPGARCDIPSVNYCFSDRFSEDVLKEWNWSEVFASQDEIFRYFQFVADKLDLRRDIQFNTRIESAIFDEVDGHWEIMTDHGDRVRAQFLITAVGCLSATNLPEFPGADSFEGDWYHSGSWPHEKVEFAGKRVGVIGTGASGVQIVPEVAKEAAHVFVFQRTPNYDMPGGNRSLSDEEMQQVHAEYVDIWRRMRETGFGFSEEPRPVAAMSVSPEERNDRFEAAWQKGGTALGLETFNDFATNQEANDAISEFIRSKIRDTVNDPKVAQLLAPVDHGFMMRRPPLEHGYYKTFNRDNVSLVDVRTSPIEEITPNGLRTSDRDYEFDTLIFATGFDAVTGPLFAIDLRGRDGIALKDKWAEGPRTYLGVATHRFPNLFTMTGPQSPSVISNVPVSSEQHAEWIGDCIDYLREHAVDRIEPLVEAEDDWVKHSTEIAEATLFAKSNSWWVGANIPGKPRLFYMYAGGVGTYRKHCEEVAAKGYEGFALTTNGAEDNET
jgi:cation diffusion facilitator CzcD-associated flavoprotein CzcO